MQGSELVESSIVRRLLRHAQAHHVMGQAQIRVPVPAAERE